MSPDSPAVHPSLDDVRKAATLLSDQVLRTPFLHSRTLSSISGAQVWLKFENHQFTASFKERGACYRLSKLDEAARRSGVVAASAGNHAQGVAYHARRLGMSARIVMPRFTPVVKIANTERLGAEVILAGETFDEARQHALELAQQHGWTFVHPYDDPDIIAGQGTLALEMLEDCPGLDALLVSVGGGGMMAGISTVVRALAPSLELIGVQTERFPGAYNAWHGQERPMAQATIAEGIAVRVPGAITTAIMRQTLDDLVLVSEEDIERAILMLLEVEKTVVEGAGAAGLAALLTTPERWQGKTVGLVLSGGNIDPLLLGDIIERGMVRAGRLARIRIDVRDVPGALARVTTIVASLNANVEQIHHQRAFTSLPIQRAEVDFVLQTRGPDHIQQVLTALQEAGFEAKLC